MTRQGRRRPPSRGGSLRAPAVVLLVLLAGAAAGAAPWGVPLGKRSVKAEISSPDDVDPYLIEAHAGALLDVRLKPAKGSDLVPDVELVGPDETPLDAPFEPSGRSLRLRRFELPETGRYELRVGSQDGSIGDYAVSAKVKGSADVGLKGMRLTSGEQRAFPFAAGGGAEVSFTVRSKPFAATFVRLESPAGDAVPLPPGSVRANAAGRLKGKRLALPADGAFGSWRLVVRADAGALDGVRVKISTRGGRLPQVRGRLPAVEPVLATVEPGEGGAGTDLLLTGFGLVADGRRPLRVFVGGIEADGVRAESATRVHATMPAGLAGPVDVGLLNGDGNAASLRGALLAVPPPRATSFEPVRGPAAGGTEVLVHGSGFREGTAVTVAGTAFPGNTELVDATLLRFVTPEFAGGPQTIGVRDPTGQESLASATFDFVAAPFVLAVRPPLVPRLPGETTTLFGGALDASQTVTVGGMAPTSVSLSGSNELRLGVPDLAAGSHEILVRDTLGQESRTPDGLSVFTLTAGPALDGSGGPPPSDVALADYDDDGDLDVFLVSAGGATLSSESLLRVLRNDGDRYTDVTDTVMPAVNGDDWRGDTIAFGDVAGDVGAPPPDGHPDLVIGSLDEDALAGDRSRVRILANRAGPGGTRVFVDRTSVLMAPPFQYDDWRAEDLWVGDLDGDGGVPDIVATHDESPEGVSPLSPYYVYYLSGTRVFSLAPPQSGGYGTFAWQSRRMPNVIGTQVPTPGLPQCIGGACRDTFTPFRGRSLVVTDLDGDGRRDVAVTTPDVVTVNGGSSPSTQVGRNRNVLGLDTVIDSTGALNGQASRLQGDILLAGDVMGDGAEDLIVVRNPATGSGPAVDIVENRGFDTTWVVRTQEVLPSAESDERLQADAAQLADVDGDGDLDLVLLVVAPPTAASTASGFGLRILRNHGEEGFSRELENLLPSGPDERWNGTVLAVGPFLAERLGLVLARPDARGTGTDVRTILRTTDE